MLRPERVTTARNLLGITQAELAEAAGLTQALVSMIETLRRPFNERTAETFAVALHLPVQFFSAQSPSLPRADVHFRKQASASARDTSRAHALFCEGFRITEDLLDKSDYPRPRLPIVQGDADVLAPEQIEEAAADTRRALGLSTDGPITNVMRALERSGIAVAPLSGIGAALDRHDGVSWTEGRGQAALIGFVPSGGDRDRFTLAHEVGHLVLHSHRQSSDPETEAHAFAGAFLLPADQALDLIPSDATLQQLMRVKASWGISIAALVKRGESVGRLDKTRVTTLFRQLSSRGWRTSEPVPVGAETPRLLHRLLQDRFGANPFSSPVIEKELALPMLTIRALVPSPAKSGAQPRPVARLHAL